MNKTQQQFIDKIAYINRRLGTNFTMDYYSPGGNPYTYRMVELVGSGQHNMTAYRMTYGQFRAYLDGWIDCLDGYATAGV